jgi:8-oxo-dGTP pyrophosphatase MutT (NUDIX family)
VIYLTETKTSLLERLLSRKRGGFRKRAKIVCTAGVILFDQEDRVLLQRRGDDNNWCIPDGAMMPGETVEEAAVREVYEETGITIDKMEFLNIFSGQEQHHIYPDGNEVYFVSTIYTSKEFHGNIIADGVESKELRFFEINDLPTTLSPTNRPMLRNLVSRRHNGIPCNS